MLDFALEQYDTSTNPATLEFNTWFRNLLFVETQEKKFNGNTCVQQPPLGPEKCGCAEGSVKKISGK